MKRALRFIGYASVGATLGALAWGFAYFIVGDTSGWSVAALGVLGCLQAPYWWQSAAKCRKPPVRP